MESAVKERIQIELEKIVGGEYVSASRPDLYNYSQDMTENEPSWPDFVVLPGRVEEVQEVLRLANREKIPVVPYTYGDNVGGLTIPLKGGIILDLKRMNRLIEFNEEDRYIVVEPGYNFGDLRRLFNEKYPHLWYSFAGAPATTSLISNAMLNGFGRLTNIVGTNADNINGIEVVLPTGEVVRIGSCSVTSSWCNRPPLPDLTGLFLGWQGATGVVTKISLQLWPRYPYKKIRTLIINGIRPVCTLARKLGQTRICEIVECWSFERTSPEGEASSGFKIEEERQLKVFTPDDETMRATCDRPPGPDKLGLVIKVAADSEDELKAKLALLDVYLKEELKDKPFEELTSSLGPAEEEDLPATGGTPLGGLTWVGTMGPTSRWGEALEKVYQIYDKYRLKRAAVMVPFRGGHFGMLRLVMQFYKGDPDEADRVKKCMREIMLAGLDYGFVPYKAPYWAVQELMKRGDPNWVDLLVKVKRLLDPNNIMNPGRYGDSTILKNN
ncbi:MAG: FAD-binding oxidoreductase [Dehalococcoidales bacterium]|nr:FAD-binding oxidoreductase [Dehalococcoidales bacterium]